MFAHNGWVSNVRDHPDALGDTDSERIFHHIMDEVSNYQQIGKIRGSIPALNKAIASVFEEYGSGINLNLLISDGSILYAYHHYPGKPLYMLRREKYYGGATLLSTQPLSGEDWQPIPADRLLVLDRGEILVLTDRLASATS